jgi:hypothetical protein
MFSILLTAALRATNFIEVAFAQAGAGGQAGAGDQPVNYTLPNPLGTTSFSDVLNRLLQGLTVIAIPIVAIIVVVAGFQLITSGGNPEKRTKAKDMILWAAIGFGVLLLADSVALIVKSFLTTT